MIKNINYINKAILDQELKDFFHDDWFYVGLTDQLQNRNDYITYKCGKVSIFIKNFEGELKCYSNICLHRFNNIHENIQGNGEFICSYHNWVYDENGYPNLQSDCLKKELRSCSRLKLKNYSLEICGKFIFVKVNDKKVNSLKDFLGSFYDKLEELSLFFDKIINDKIELIPHKANWKLLVENVLECYHCSSVHKDTLTPLGIGSKKPENNFNENGHDKIDYPVRVTKLQKEREFKLTFLNKSNYLHNSLQHWYICPNLFITSSVGNLFYIGRINPCEYDFTELHAQFVLPKYFELTNKEKFLLKAYSESSVLSSKKVIYEDKQILEQIQNNLNCVPEEKQIFGDEEFRIEAFHKILNNKINYK